MKYRETKRLMMKYHPEIFPSEKEILHHLFFVNGNGYDWENGDLVDFMHRSEAKLREDRKDFLAWSKRLSGDTDKAMKKLKRLGVKIPDSVPKMVGRKRIYPLCKYADIMNIPDDVKLDWLKAARKALDVSRNLKRTKEDIQWLVKARKRICELEER